jgi:Protein of unknown function (DUF732)
MRSTFAALAAASLMLAACHGDSPDDRFVAALDSHGIPGDRGAEISEAHQFCDTMRHVADDQKNNQAPLPQMVVLGTDIQALRNQLTSQGLSDDQSIQFMADAGDTVCPDVKDQIQKGRTDNE